MLGIQKRKKRRNHWIQQLRHIALQRHARGKIAFPGQAGMGERNTIGKYEIISTLGQGAMGVVYKAFDPHIERTVALKTIRKDILSPKDLEPLLTRFKQEAMAAGRLTHPGIVTVYEYGEDEGTAFIAMEFVQGRELKEILDNNERLRSSTATNLILQLLDALSYAHAQNVVHRDIKPGNIFMLQDGRIKVTDFGIAKIESSTLTQFGEVFGTPSSMSPEQFTGQPVDSRSDLFSVGALLYQLLTGEKPFPGNSLPAIMHRVLHSVPPKVSELNFHMAAEIDQVVNKAMAKKATERFQTATEFAAALKKAHEAATASADESFEDETRWKHSARDEATLYEASPAETTVAAPEKPPGAPSAETQDTTETSIDSHREPALESPKTEHHSPRDRRPLLIIVILIVLSLCSYLVWHLSDSNQPMENHQQLAKEKTGGSSSNVPNPTPVRKEMATKLSASPKKTTEAKGRSETASASSHDLSKKAKVPEETVSDKTIAEEPPPAKKAPPAETPDLSKLSWPPDQSWVSKQLIRKP